MDFVRKIIFIVITICSLNASAQFTDSFADGDFTIAPTWVGDVTLDTVVAQKLQSNCSVASSSFYISTQSNSVNNCQWEFWVNLAFNTSSVNYTDIYLIADQSNLKSATLNGYFVRIGDTQDDVCLYKNTSGTIAKIIDGIDFTTNHANTTLKVKVVRDNLNQFTLYDDFTGTGNNYLIDGLPVTDNSFLSSISFGVLIKQSTASFFKKHFFDDFYVGPIITDVLPPSLLSSTVISSVALDVLFNEDVELTTSQTAINYSVNNGIGPAVSAVRDAINFKLVHLTFSSPFTNALTNTITINFVQDIALNPIVNGTSSFIYYSISNPAYKDVIITEIMSDPNPSISTLPIIEWIEIYNASGTKTFDMAGWNFSDATTTATLNNKYLLPGQYIVLCRNVDTSSLSPFGNVLGMSTMPSLNDAGDNIYLQDNVGNFIDSVNYDITWYNDNTKDGGGWTLELINPNLPLICNPSSNWAASINPNGASFAAQNSNYSNIPDVTGPIPLQVTIVDSLHIIVCFNESVLATQVNIVTNYLINNSIGTPISASIIANCIELSLSAPLQNLNNYTINFFSMGDCSGNPISPNSINFSFYIPSANDVIVNEILPDPDPSIGLPNYEYIELFNRTNYAISLKNWTVSSPSTTKIIPDITIEPDSFVVLTGTSGYTAFTNFNIAVFAVTSFPALTNAGSSITIKNQQGKIINSVTYTDDWYQDATKKEGGYSLELIDPNNPCAESENWRASNQIIGGTPGNKNSIYANNPDFVSPKLKRIAVLSSDSIQLFFDEKIDSTSMLALSTYSIDNSINIPISATAIPNDFKSVKLKLASNLQVGIIYTCVITLGIKDCAGNVISYPNNSTRFALPEPAAAGDIIINELLFDPNTGGVDFVEIYNNTVKTIDLSKLNIGSQDTITNLLTYTVPINTEGYLIFPQTYLVISESENIVKSQYYTSNPNGFLDINSLPSMNTTGDVVVISDNTSLIIDKVIYSDKMHFPLLNTNKGVSLERIDFSRASLDFTNWNSAASTVGFATPAYRNSQYLNADIENGITISPETFSPDNDGYQDVLSVSFSFDKPGKVANLQIFDSNGRLIRRLIKNETLSQSGTISWNGLNDVNEKAPIGIYIIYFEATDVVGGKISKFKKSCVLAGRL